MSASKRVDHSALSAYMQSMGKSRPATPEREQDFAWHLIEAESRLMDALMRHPKSHKLLSELEEHPFTLQLMNSDPGPDPMLKRTTIPPRIELLRRLDGDRKQFQNWLKSALQNLAPEFRTTVRPLANAYLSARNDFMKGNLRLVVSIATKFNHRSVGLVDMIQEGNLGLIRAIHRYDPSKGFRFSTYAHWWIRQAIERSLMNNGSTIRIPVHVFDARRELRKIERQYQEQGIELPAADEMAALIGVSLDRYREIVASAHVQPSSLDAACSVGGEGGRTVAEVVTDPKAEAVDDRVDRKRMAAKLGSMLHELSPMEGDILRKRFGLEDNNERTLADIGVDYDLSRERIRQIQEKGLLKLRKYCERRLRMTA